MLRAASFGMHASNALARHLSLQAACINCLKVSALVYELEASAAAQHYECDHLRHALSEPYRHVTLVGRCDGVMIVCGEECLPAPHETVRLNMVPGDSTQRIMRAASPKHSSFGAHARTAASVNLPTTTTTTFTLTLVALFIPTSFVHSPAAPKMSPQE